MNDDTKPVIVITGGTDNGAFFDAARRESDRHDVVVLTPNEPIPDLGHLRDDHTADVGRPVQPHRSGGGVNILDKGRSTRRISSMATIAALAMLGAMPGGAYNPNTGREASRRNSQRLAEERERRAQLRSEHNARQRATSMSPNFAAPYGAPRVRSQIELDRIAAAEAKRARKAAKRSKT